MPYSLYFISTFECFHPFRNQPCSDVFNLEIFWSTSQLVTHQSNACFLQKRKSWNEEWIKLNLLKVEWMCFSHIFPCLSCDEGQVAQIENQEVSKKFISKNLHCDTEKLNSIFAVFKKYVWFSSLYQMYFILSGLRKIEVK